MSDIALSIIEKFQGRLTECLEQVGAPGGTRRFFGIVAAATDGIALYKAQAIIRQFTDDEQNLEMSLLSEAMTSLVKDHLQGMRNHTLAFRAFEALWHQSIGELPPA